MMKIFDLDRNDKCPCGSGKKYKKCCMDSIEDKKRGILKVMGEGLTSEGVSVVNVLSVMLGLKLGGKNFESENFVNIIKKAWEDDENDVNILNNFKESFKKILIYKQGLKNARIPADMLLEEKMKDLEFKEAVQEYIFGRDFIEFLLLEIAKSLRNDEYSEEELKIIVLAVSYAVDELMVEHFMEAVYNASVEEIQEINKKLKEMLRGTKNYKEFDYDNFLKEANKVIEEYPNAYRFFGETLRLNLEEVVKELLDSPEKLDFPLFAIYPGLVEFCIMAEEKLKEEEKKLDFKEVENITFNLLSDERIREYFIKGMQIWWIKKIVKDGNNKIFSIFKETEENIIKLANIILFFVFPFTSYHLEALSKIYASSIVNFVKNIPRKIDDSNMILNDISELFSSEFIGKYVKYLKDKFNEKAAGFVSGYFYRIQELITKKGDGFKERLQEAIEGNDFYAIT